MKKHFFIIAIALLFGIWVIFRSYYQYKKASVSEKIERCYNAINLGETISMRTLPPPSYTLFEGEFLLQRWALSVPLGKWKGRMLFIDKKHVTLDIAYSKKEKKILGKWLMVYEPFPDLRKSCSKTLPECPVHR